MKKQYIIPQTELLEAQQELPITVSGVHTNTQSDVDIDYGGVDSEGLLDPSVKENDFDFWE